VGSVETLTPPRRLMTMNQTTHDDDRAYEALAHVRRVLR